MSLDLVSRFCPANKQPWAAVPLSERSIRPQGYLSMAYILIVDSQAEFGHQLVLQLEKAGHRASAVATVSAATKLMEDEVPDLLATDGVLSDGSSTSLVQQAEAAGAKVLMMTGNPDRIIEFDGAGQPYVSKPIAPEGFMQRVRQVLGDTEDNADLSGRKA